MFLSGIEAHDVTYKWWSH